MDKDDKGKSAKERVVDALCAVFNIAVILAIVWLLALTVKGIIWLFTGSW